jgi:hypothetical protein
MPKKKVEKVHVNITIDEDLNQWLEKTAAELRMNKSQLINNLILMGKDDVGVLKGTGVLGAAKVIKELKEELLKLKRKGIAVKGGE